MFGLNKGNQILLTYLFPSYLAISFVILFLFRNGLSLVQLISIILVMAISCATTTLLIKRIKLRVSLLLGYGLSGLALLSLLLDFPYYYYLYPIIIGITAGFFWIPANYLYFINCNKKDHTSTSSWYFNLSAFFGIILPPLGALIIRRFGFSLLFLIGGIIYFLLLIFIWKIVPNDTYQVPISNEIPKFKKLKTITLLEGSLHYFSGYIIPIFTLFFIQKELEWGAYLSYLALLGIIVSFFLSKRSDKNGKRWIYLLVLFSFLSMVITILGFVKEAWLWILLTGIFAILNTISYPIHLAFSMDVKEVDLGFWKVREFFLNVGRVIALSLCLIFVLLGFNLGVFILFALICLLYLYLIKRKFIDWNIRD